MSTVSKKTERPLSTVVTKPNGFLCFFLFVVGGLSVVLVVVLVVVVGPAVV